MITETRNTEIDGVPVVTVVSDAPDNDAAVREIECYARAHGLVRSGEKHLLVEQANGHRHYRGLAYPAASVVSEGLRLYENTIRAIVEEGNIGRLVAIDIPTGQYYIANAETEAVNGLKAMGAGKGAVYLQKIGYQATASVGGSIPRQVRQ